MKKVNTNQGSQGGFTLIELVVTIVIASILGAALVATYVDLTGEAQDANITQAEAATESAIALAMAENEGAAPSADDIAGNLNGGSKSGSSAISFTDSAGTSYTINLSSCTTGGQSGYCGVSSTSVNS